MNLFDLYHPGGMRRVASESTASRECGCGCAPVDVGPGEIDVRVSGIKDTPALLAIAELEKVRRAAEPKPAKAPRPWRGASVEDGTVELPAEVPCKDPACKEVHVAHYLDWEPRVGQVQELRHLVSHPARVYRLPNGAVAKVRIDAGKKL